MCPPNQFTWGIFASTGLATRQLVHGVEVNMALLAIGTTSKDALIMISQVQQDFWLPSEMWCGCSLEGMYMAAIHVMGPLIRFVIFGFPANIMYYYILLFYIYIYRPGWGNMISLLVYPRFIWISTGSHCRHLSILGSKISDLVEIWTGGVPCSGF